MTKRSTTSTRTKADPAEPTDIIEVNAEDTERTRQLDYDVQVFETKVEKRDRYGNISYKWQPTGKLVPVLLIRSPNTFKPEHDAALRTEPTVERKVDKKIRGALKRHQRDGELYYEVGESDEQMDDVIEYAITLLRTYGVESERAIRFTPYISRAEW
jgi:hypothetical protein